MVCLKLPHKYGFKKEWLWYFAICCFNALTVLSRDHLPHTAFTSGRQSSIFGNIQWCVISEIKKFA